jgi:hypothetical protein
MSKVAIIGNASGTGVFTVASPNSNVDRVLTLPDETGTVLTTAGVPTSAMPAGSVLQVVQVYSTTQVSVSGSDVSIGLSKAITVQANSKVLVMSNYGWFNDGSASAWSNAGTSRLFQGATALAFTEHNGTITGEAASWQISCNYLTASLTAGTYTFEVKHSRTIGGTHVCMRDARAGTLTLMEIAA